MPQIFRTAALKVLGFARNKFTLLRKYEWKRDVISNWHCALSFNLRRLSAARTDDGGFAIDPAELFRVYPPKSPSVAAERSTAQGAGRNATSDETSGIAPETIELAAKMAAMEADLRAMKEMLAEVKQSRDDWREQVTRMTVLLPKATRINGCFV